jgi:general secretion pathway protein D
VVLVAVLCSVAAALGPATAQPARTPLPPPPRGGAPVSLNFDQADLETVVLAVSQIVGFNYVLAPDVRGKITVRTATPIARHEVFGVLLAILEAHGFTAVKADGVYKVIRIEGAAQRPVPTVVGAEAVPGRPDDEVITHVARLRFASAPAVATLLRPLVAPNRHLAAHADANILIVTDTAANVRRVLEIVRLVDVETARGDLQLITLRFADPAEVAAILTERQRRSATPGDAIVVLADPRSGSVVLHGPKTEVATLKELAARLDVPFAGGRVFIYPAQHTRAKDLAATVTAIYAERAPAEPATRRPPRIVADENTNGVLVTASAREWSEIEILLKDLDRHPRQVVVDVRVVEVTLTHETEVGLDFAKKEGIKLISFNTAVTAAAVATGVLPGLTVIGLATDGFEALLRAIATDNKVTLVSATSVMVAENRKAVINASDSIPIVTSQQLPIGGTTVPTADATTAVVGTQTVEYRDVGVILTVTPRIGDDGTVALDVKPEANEIGPPEPPTGSRRILKRQLEASVAVGSNQTLVLGGFTRTRETIEERGIPLLKDIPVLGALFRNQLSRREKREVLVLITPRVATASR